MTGPWVWTGDEWLHRPRWKVTINTVLRWFQPGPRKWVIASECLDGEREHPSRPPTLVGYTFARVLHRHVPRARVFR